MQRRSASTSAASTPVVAAFAVILLAACSGSVEITTDDRQDRLEELVATTITEDYLRQGITFTVTSTDCTDLPMEEGEFTVDCRMLIAESSETIPLTVRVTVTGDQLQTDAETRSGLLTQQGAIDYAQGLVDQIDERVSVVACDLGDEIMVVDAGDFFTCETDTDEIVEVTLDEEGVGTLTDVYEIE